MHWIRLENFKTDCCNSTAHDVKPMCSAGQMPGVPGSNPSAEFPRLGNKIKGEEKEKEALFKLSHVFLSRLLLPHALSI